MSIPLQCGFIQSQTGESTWLIHPTNPISPIVALHPWTKTSNARLRRKVVAQRMPVATRMNSTRLKHDKQARKAAPTVKAISQHRHPAKVVVGRVVAQASNMHVPAPKATRMTNDV